MSMRERTLRERIAEIVTEAGTASLPQMPGHYADRILALLDDPEPVAWKVEHRPHLDPGYVELWTSKERADRQAESIRIGYPDDVVTVTPLYTSPTPTQATEEIERLRADKEEAEVFLGDVAEAGAEAQEECERLRERVEELEGALREIVEKWEKGFLTIPEERYDPSAGEQYAQSFAMIARRALTSQEEDANG